MKVVLLDESGFFLDETGIDPPPPMNSLAEEKLGEGRLGTLPGQNANRSSTD